MRERSRGTVGRVPILASAVAALVLAGCLGGMPGTQYALEPGPWQGDSIIVTISAVERGGGHSADRVGILLGHPNGATFFSGFAGETQTLGGVTTTVTFEDATTPGVVGAGDRIRVTLTQGASAQVRGATLTIGAGSDPGGAAVLP